MPGRARRDRLDRMSLEVHVRRVGGDGTDSISILLAGHGASWHHASRREGEYIASRA